MSVNNGQEEFDLIIADSDTALFRAARGVEEDYLIVTCNQTGVSKEFSNVTTFYGKAGWLPEMNNFLGLTLTKEDFTLEQCVRLKPNIVDHLEEAVKLFSYYVGSLKGSGYAKDYRLAVGGTGNFRFDYGKFKPYKGARKEKPILYKELYDRVVQQYASKMLIADGQEADDLLGIYGAANQRHFLKTGKYKYLLAYMDKDIKQVWGATYFLHKKELGVVFIEKLEAAKHLALQLLKGDPTDNIHGVGKVATSTLERLNLRKVKGCGDVTANALIASCNTPLELFQAVVDTYREAYPEQFKSPTGETYTWQELLRENAILLWMCRFHNQRFDIFEELLTPLGVNFEPIN